MAIPSSGPISLSTIQTEFGGPSSPISLGSYYKGGSYVSNTDSAPSVPTSGAISIGNFYGAAKVTIIDAIVIGGGGSGGCFTGGGAGGLVTFTNYTLSPGTYTITVGAGGAFPPANSSPDGNGGTRVYFVAGISGNSGGTSSFGAIASGNGGGGGVNNSNGGSTGNASGPPGATTYSRGFSGRPGAGSGSANNGTYGGGSGVSITLGGLQSFTLGGGGSGSAYWNVGGSTPGGNTPGGSGIGGVSGLVAGDRSNGINPDAGLGNPPPNNSAYVTGGTGVANTGSGGGSASRAEVIFGNGDYGCLGGPGGSGVVILGYTGPQKSWGGTVTVTGSYVTHKFTSSTSITV